jgi:hypothetical protein
MDAITASQEASGNLTNSTVEGLFISIHILYCKIPECLSRRRNWVPSREIECVPPPWTQRVEQHSLACEEVGGPNSDDWIESLTL